VRTATEVRTVTSSARPFEGNDAAPAAREVAPSARASESIPSPPVRASGTVQVERVDARRTRAELRVETKPTRDDNLLVPASTPPDPPVRSTTAAAREDGSALLPGVEPGRAAGDPPEAPGPERQTGEAADDREGASEALLMPVARGAEAREVDGNRAKTRADARQAWAEPVAQAEKERPVVQVTIGRIEVRAVHPPAEPQPTRGAGWTPPVLSLDEYLKRGGGR
jgi:hypothetical protein